VHKIHETPKERLERTQRYSLPRKRKVGGPWYLVAAGLLILIFALLAIGLLAGLPAMEIMRAHAEQILRYASSW
jgi:hypothetical protein